MKLKVAVILDNKEREYEYSVVLKKQLEKKLKADVFIIGSIAEKQRIILLLYIIKPHFVFMSQVFEDSCRQVARYVHEAGAKVCIIPSEVRPSEAYIRLAQSKLSFDSYVDYLFLPGKNLSTIFSYTDISKKKFYITGSPKIDVSLSTKTESKKKFLSRHNIPQTYKKYITIFTSFIDTNTEYLLSDPLFKDQVAFKKTFNACVIETRIKYQKALAALAKKYPSYAFLVKPHPLEKKSLQCTEKNVYFIQNAKAPDLFKVTNLAIHWLSTVALECWFHAIPVIEYFPVKQKRFLPDFHLGNPLYFTQKNLLLGVDQYLTVPIEREYLEIQKKYLKYSFFSLDGKSATRIAEVLQKSNKNILVNYRFSGSILTVGVLLLEKMMGVTLSRKLINKLLPTYKADYAIKNYIFEQ